MPNAARLTDAVDGTTAGEHSGARPPTLPRAIHRGDLRGLFRGRAGERPGGRDGGKYHHRAGRVLWIQPGCGGGRQRNRADQRKSGGPHRRRPGPP